MVKISHKTCTNLSLSVLIGEHIISHHSFVTEIAAIIGLNLAVMFLIVTFWVEKRQANQCNL
jgi:hypothetical protein